MANAIITVSELARLCQNQISEGRGEAKIIIPGDDEGNVYHALLYGFSKPKKFGIFDSDSLPYGLSEVEFKEECIVLD